jgi:hypothetical protein
VSDCDLNELCTGGDSCPTDLFRPLGHVCRGPAGDCDPPETCDGTNRGCPADLLAPTTQLCRRAAAGSAGACDVDDYCDNKNPKCPMDVKQPAGTNCRESAGQCDVPELCDGAQSACPANLFRPMSANFVCRESAGICDRPEVCNGASAQCPPDVFAVGSPCRPIPDDPFAAQCDIAELCGNGPECPANAFKMLGFPCDDRSVDTDNDVCGPGGVCSGKCLVDKACNDGQKCTEDTCGVDGRCIFAPIDGCAVAVTLPPTNCTADASFSVDLLRKPRGNATAIDTCFFGVNLVGVKTSLERIFDNGTERATSLTIVEKGAATIRFVLPWRSALEALVVVGLFRDSVVAVARGEFDAGVIDEAVMLFDLNRGNRTSFSSVWFVTSPGLNRAPPSFLTLQSPAWTIVNVRGGRNISLEGIVLSRPVDGDNRPWSISADATTTTVAGNAPSSSAVDVVLIGSIVGGVVAFFLLAGGIALCVVQSKKRRRANTAPEAATEMHSAIGDSERRDVPVKQNYQGFNAIGDSERKDVPAEQNYQGFNAAASPYDRFEEPRPKVAQYASFPPPSEGPGYDKLAAVNPGYAKFPEYDELGAVKAPNYASAFPE